MSGSSRQSNTFGLACGVFWLGEYLWLIVAPCKIKIFALLVLSSFPLFAESKPAGWDELVMVYYRLEVTNYCGLTSHRVGTGFAFKRDRILKQHALSPAHIDSARAQAWKAGYREWDNRGLGGFKRWCANEGMSYVAFFTDE